MVTKGRIPWLDPIRVVLSDETEELVSSAQLLDAFDGWAEQGAIDEKLNCRLALFGNLSAYYPPDVEHQDGALNILMIGPHGAGKTPPMNRVSQIFPPQDVMKVAKWSRKALYYLASWDNDTERYVFNAEGKILLFYEQPPNDVLEELRPHGSHDAYELSHVVVIGIGKQDGMRQTQIIIVRGWPVFYMLTTNSLTNIRQRDVRREWASRCILTEPTMEKEKYQNVVDHIFRRSKLPIKRLPETDASSLSEWIRYIKKQMVDGLEAIILHGDIISETLSPIAEDQQAQRDAAYLSKLIKMVAVFHLRQRLIVEGIWEGEASRFVLVSVDDIVTAVNLYSSCFDRMDNRLGKASRFYQAYLEGRGDRTLPEMLEAAAKQGHHVSRSTAKGWLEELCLAGIASVVRESKGRNPTVYRGESSLQSRRELSQTVETVCSNPMTRSSVEEALTSFLRTVDEPSITVGDKTYRGEHLQDGVEAALDTVMTVTRKAAKPPESHEAGQTAPDAPTDGYRQLNATERDNEIPNAQEGMN